MGGRLWAGVSRRQTIGTGSDPNPEPRVMPSIEVPCWVRWHVPPGHGKPVLAALQASASSASWQPALAWTARQKPSTSMRCQHTPDLSFRREAHAHNSVLSSGWGPLLLTSSRRLSSCCRHPVHSLLQRRLYKESDAAKQPGQ